LFALSVEEGAGRDGSGHVRGRMFGGSEAVIFRSDGGAGRRGRGRRSQRDGGRGGGGG